VPYSDIASPGCERTSEYFQLGITKVRDRDHSHIQALENM